MGRFLQAVEFRQKMAAKFSLNGFYGMKKSSSAQVYAIKYERNFASFKILMKNWLQFFLVLNQVSFCQ